MSRKSYSYYTNGEVNKRVYEGQDIPEGFYLGTTGSVAWNKGLTKEDPRVAKYIRPGELNGMYGKKPWNYGLTKETDNRIVSTAGSKNGMYGKHPKAWNAGLTKETSESVLKISESNQGKKAWNDGLTKETSEAMKKLSRPRSEEVKEKIRQTHLTPECKQKRYNTMKANGSFNQSKPEEDFYQTLLRYFYVDDVKRQYTDERYPFQCDFYISSLDLFIECNFFFTHGDHPFDPTNEEDILLKENLSKLASDKGGLYKNQLYVWTDLDYRRVQTAINNNLNYMMFYSYDYGKPGEFMETPFYIVDNHELRFIDNEQSATTIESIFKKKNLEE